MVVFGALLLWQPCIKYKTFSTGFLRLRCLYFNWGFHAIRNVCVCLLFLRCLLFIYAAVPLPWVSYIPKLCGPVRVRVWVCSWVWVSVPTFVCSGGVLFTLDQGKSCGQDQDESHRLPGENRSGKCIHFAGISMGILCFGVVLQSRLFLKTVYYFCVLSRVLGPDSPVIVALIFRFPTLFLAFPGSCSVVVLFISFPFGLAGISCFSRFFLQLLAFSISSF